MSGHDLTYIENISSMLQDLEFCGMKKPPRGRISLRSGTTHFVHGLRQIPIKQDSLTNYEIVGYQPESNSQYSEVRFLASDVESVMRLELSGISPERAAESHAAKGIKMVDTIMSPAAVQEERMDRFRRLGANCTDTRPGWFTQIVQMHIDQFDEAKMASSDLDVDILRALLSDDEDDREVPAAVMLILIDFCYDALEQAYLPYIEEQEWIDAAMTLVDERLHGLGV